jgi:hypothetical protein
VVNEFCKLTGKRRYQSRTEAKQANHGIHKRGGYSKTSKAVTPYRCRACGAWHLGRERT